MKSARDSVAQARKEEIEERRVLPCWGMPPFSLENGRLCTRVCRDGDGIRAYLRHVLHFPSHTAAVLSNSAILIDGRVPEGKERLQTGQMLSVDLREPRKETVLPRPIPLCVLYEDAHILVLSKPPFVPTHPSHGHFEDTLANGVAYRCEEKGENFPFRPVNRLDRDTSGVVLVSKHRLAAARLAMEMAAGMIRKKYLAVTAAPLLPREGEICLPIGRKEGSAMLRCVRADGDFARTVYRTVWEGEGLCAILVAPQTGRTHQIRVHLSAMGSPILGDFLYGTEDQRIPRQALHALSLSFIHPMSGERMEVRAPLPSDIEALFPPRFAQELSSYNGLFSEET